MRDLNESVVLEQAEALLKSWQESRRVVLRGASGELVGALAEVAKYLPYLLATIFYGTEVYGLARDEKVRSDTASKIRLWIDEAIDRVLQFAPRGGITQEACREDLGGIVDALSTSLTAGELVAAADAVSNKLYGAVRRIDPTIGERERGLVDYIVRAELRRLSL